MQKYRIKKNIRIVDIENTCYLYDCGKFVEYRLDKKATNLVRKINNKEDIIDQDNVMLQQLLNYEIIVSDLQN